MKYVKCSYSSVKFFNKEISGGIGPLIKVPCISLKMNWEGRVNEEKYFSFTSIVDDM